MKMYAELAAWWPLLSPPSHYVEEAEDLLADLTGPGTGPAPRTLLELGAGGGSVAWHLKRHLQLTLTDISPDMIAQSRAANPECEHVSGDMRTLDLGRTFDRVLVHDAIMYATDPDMLRAVFRTAHRHLKPGGMAVFVPDCVRETFQATTDHGGEEAADGRGLRYLEWSWDPDPADDTFQVAYAFLLREPSGQVRVEQDRHTEGLFARASWLEWLRDTGFTPTPRMDRWDRDVFRAVRT